jgi:hypothetical protein
VKRRLSGVVGYSPDRNEVNAEADESPLLEAVTRERLKTQQTEDLAYAAVICKVWRLAMAL